MIFGVMICLGIFYAQIYFSLLQIKGATILEYICRHNDLLHQCHKLIFIGLECFWISFFLLAYFLCSTF